jgi:hypothetical protein
MVQQEQPPPPKPPASPQTPTPEQTLHEKVREANQQSELNAQFKGGR